MTKPLKVAVEVIVNNLETPKTILEVGSRQAINQNDLADLRPLFPKSKFVGLDMQKGPGVDVVASAEKLPYKDKSFDMVICLETLEHAERPWVIAKEIQRVLKNSGVVIVSSQQNFPIHMHPSDFFRYTPFGMKSLFGELKKNLVVAISPPFSDEVKLNPQHVILIGTKKNDAKIFPKIKRSLRKNISLISGHKPYRHRLESIFAFLKRAYDEIWFRFDIEFF